MEPVLQKMNGTVREPGYRTPSCIYRKLALYAPFPPRFSEKVLRQQVFSGEYPTSGEEVDEVEYKVFDRLHSRGFKKMQIKKSTAKVVPSSFVIAL